MGTAEPRRLAQMLGSHVLSPARYLSPQTRRSLQLGFRRLRKRWMVRRAFSGADPNLASIERFLLSNYTSFPGPLILISQVHRSGGTLLSQLLDGHPELAAHPHELKIGYPSADDWPAVDPALGASENFRRLFESYTIAFMKSGFRKGKHDQERRPFYIVPRLQVRLFETLFRERNPAGERDILDCFFISFFNAWLNWQGNLRNVRYVSGFAPRLADTPDHVDRFFDTYPDGFLIKIIRDPRSWVPSARHHDRGAPSSVPIEDLILPWKRSADAVLYAKRQNPDRVIVLRFEDLLGSTEALMRTLSDRIGIAFSPQMLVPTFNGLPMRANSSFEVSDAGVVDAPLRRAQMLSPDEDRIVGDRYMPLYERIVGEALSIRASVTGPTPRSTQAT